MAEIVAFTGFITIIVLFLSFYYNNERDELQPKWWYAVSAICIVCHCFLAVLIYQEFPILTAILFVAAGVLSYITCRMAVLEDKIRRIRKQIERKRK